MRDMPRSKKIFLNPKKHKNYFLLDANFLVYASINERLLNSHIAFDDKESNRASCCLEWWKIIKGQLDKGKARIYVPDICIAEAFKVLAKWYYKKKFFKDGIYYNQAKKRLRKLLTIPYREMTKHRRHIKVHDLSTNRDIIIGVDRFYEILYKGNDNVQISDLILLASAKYLMEFFDINKEYLFIISCDSHLSKLSGKIQEIPAVINPTEGRYSADKTFVKEEETD